MILWVLMAGHDPGARTIFDGMYDYSRAHPTATHSNLMSWYQNTSCNDANGNFSATDGGLDIAFALLLADKQGGSCGAIDHLSEATSILADVKDGDLDASALYTLLGDWVSPSDPQYYPATRTSRDVGQLVGTRIRVRRLCRLRRRRDPAGRAVRRRCRERSGRFVLHRRVQLRDGRAGELRREPMYPLRYVHLRRVRPGPCAIGAACTICGGTCDETGAARLGVECRAIDRGGAVARERLGQSPLTGCSPRWVA
jgi:hypothetical protein